MGDSVLSAHSSTLCLLLAPLVIQAADLWVSTNGTPTGPGTAGQPYDLATALAGEVGGPGDTFWLRGGHYQIGHIDTRIEGSPEQPITFRQMPGEWARIDGSLTFFESMGNVVLRDLEIYSSDTNRASAQIGVGFDVTDITIIPGIASYSPNLSFINLIVHDHTRHGFYLSQLSSNNLIYGCVVYNNGWVSPDNAEGHGVYAQVALGNQEIADNVVLNNSGAGMHIYENAAGSRLEGLTLDGNVAFNAGAIQNVREYRDWLVGVDEPAVGADRILLKDNMGYYSILPAQIGRQGINGTVSLLNNYFPQGLLLNNWSNAAVAGNLLSAQWGNSIVNLDQSQVFLAAAWDENTYVRSAEGIDFLINLNSYTFAEWQSATGYDEHSTYSAEYLSGTKVFVRSNRHEAGRAHIIVYNWDSLNSVPVDVSSVLATGAPYEVRNGQDFFGGPVLSGVFDGQPLELPMSGLTAAAPNGPLLTAPPSGPMLNVFILLPRMVRLRIAQVNGQAEVSWPTNAGNWALQFTASNEDWVDDTETPAIRGDQYVVTNSFSEVTRLYRLRAAQ